MFYAKMHDEEDNELPRYGEEEEGKEQPQEIVEEVEEIIVEEDTGEEEAEAPAAPAPRKRAPAKKAKKAKNASPKKKKAKSKSKAKVIKARRKKGGKRRKR